MADAARQTYDLFIIGGGINGCGIARDAAGRGFQVAVAEMNDLASGTSSGSTKLVHGGLRYLEYYEFRLVREALKEREVLWAIAPHIIKPMRFILPHHKGLRPAWMLRIGLFLYDHIGGRRRLPPTRVLDLSSDEAGKPLKPVYRKAFEYSDCWADDARLVVLNASDARQKGAKIMPRTRVVSARAEEGVWLVTTNDAASGEERTHRARMLVNAGGPWVDQVIAGTLHRNDPRNVRLVKGSHIVIKRKFEHDRAYFFQNDDDRIFFAIPYDEDFTLIGTTDLDFEGDLDRIEISEQEIGYLCEGASNYFLSPVTRDDIVWTFSAVRPLYDDGASKAQEATRDYVLKREMVDDAPMLNIFGGKITTYRKLAEAALVEVEKALGRRGDSWTADTPLPGGDFPVDAFAEIVSQFHARHSFLDEAEARRLIRLYGTNAELVVGAAETQDDMGTRFGGSLTEREVQYLIDEEWAVTAEDVLWRRTKQGLRFSEGERSALDSFMRTAARTETGVAGTPRAEEKRAGDGGIGTGTGVGA